MRSISDGFLQEFVFYCLSERCSVGDWGVLHWHLKEKGRSLWFVEVCFIVGPLGERNNRVFQEDPSKV